MELTVDRLGAVVVDALRAAGYMESTIGQYGKSIRYLSAFAADRGGVYSPALGAAFAAGTTSPRTGRFSAQRRFDYRRLVWLLDGYLATGSVDVSVRGRGGGGPRPSGAGFMALDAAWEADMGARGLAQATCSAYGRTAREFMVFLESRGVDDLDRADGGAVLEFLASLSDRWATTSMFWVVSNFRPFLRFCGREDLIAAVGLAGARRAHRIVAVLDDATVSMVVDACAARKVTARDAAITLLALATGLRACDIIALRLADVDWHAGTISIVQAKTGNPLMLPMPGLLAARMGEYLLHARPDTADDHVFVRTKAPHTRLADHASVYAVVDKVFQAAGVRGARVGTRALRHSAASRLLRAHVPLPTISAILGHASQESTNTYLSVDTDRLLACVLPVPAGARP